MALADESLGSASLTTDASGAVVSEMRYFPYGETRSGGAPTDRRYTGQREEVGLGLYDYGARYYDPALGRFIQADTIVPEPQSPQLFNRYTYVLNNPLHLNDPSGHVPAWVDFLMGATYQVANDMSYGAFNAVLCLTVDAFWDTRQAESFYEGQEVGRNASQAVGTTLTGYGLATAAAGIAAMGPTAGGTLALAGPSAGSSVVVGGVALSTEAVAVVGGAATAAYGTGVVLYAKNNPLPGRSGGGGRFTTNQRLVMRELGLSKRDFNAAIHDIKDMVEGNPDMLFDLDTGDVFDQRSGEIVGNLLDYLEP